MRAMDVMTTNVITVSPDTSVQEVATLLSERGISGVPVVDAENRLVGIVSEGDLLHRVETGTDRRPDRRSGRRRSWWLDTVGSDEELARDYVKSHGRTAKDVMTSEVISVSETTELADIANLLETKRIKRVPVVRDGRLVGIVSRANLVRALAAAGSRLTHRHRHRRSHDPPKTPGRATGAGMGSYLGGGHHRQGWCRALLGVGRPPRRREAGLARRGREHSRRSRRRGAHRAGSDDPTSILAAARIRD